jgi:hypothetical protein
VGSLDAKSGSATTPPAVDTMDAARMLSLAAPARFGLNARLEMDRGVTAPLFACVAGGAPGARAGRSADGNGGRYVPGHGCVSTIDVPLAANGAAVGQTSSGAAYVHTAAR